MEIVRRQPTAEPLPLDPLLARVFANRGVANLDDVTTDLSRLLLPGSLPDIDIAGSRLAQAIMRDETIMVVGDFDADGATSVALCMLVMRALGARHLEFLVPNRFEYGYGLSPEIVELAASYTPQVIVTVDNGVSSIDGVALANAKGIDVVVTDHHLPGDERPATLALVNPNLPESQFESKALAGVGVAYYVLSVVRAKLKEHGFFDGREMPNLAQYLDLVALGTVADVVPLDRNNRVLVEQGLRRMRAGACQPGIKALAEIAKRSLHQLTAQDLAFSLGPRLNAAGRLEDMALGIKCLMAEEFSEARRLAVALDQLNKARRTLEADMVGDAQIMLADDQVTADRVGISVYHESFHQGVVGIVAGRLREKLHKPAIVFADAGDTAPDELKGSARSIDGLHIRDVLDSIAVRHPGLLIKFGGHAMAAGLSIKRLHFQRFSVIFDKAVRAQVDESSLKAQLVTDGSLDAVDLTLANAQALSQAGPWGACFEEPMFDDEFELVSQRVVGETHLRMTLKRAGRVVDAIAFRQAPLAPQTKNVRAAYRLQQNDYGDVPTLNLIVSYIESLP